jgi:hypothetical protein
LRHLGRLPRSIAVAASVGALTIGAAGGESLAATPKVGAAARGSTAVVNDHGLLRLSVRMASALPGGGQEFVYPLPDGRAAVEVAIPRKGFRPLSASAAQLALYGFPSRPHGGAALRSWLRAMRDYRSTPVPNFLVAPRAVAPRTLTTTTSYSGWAAESTDYIAAIAEWAAPTVANPQPSECVDSLQNPLAIWTGLTNGTNGTLIQSGISWNSPTKHAWVPFWETINPSNNPAYDTAVTITPGQPIYTQTGWEEDQNGGTGHFYVENEATGKALSASVGNIGTMTFSLGEFMTEVPHFISYTTVKFSNFSFNNAVVELATSGAEQSLGSQKTQSFSISNDNAMYPGSISGNGESFVSYWKSCY